MSTAAKAPTEHTDQTVRVCGAEEPAPLEARDPAPIPAPKPACTQPKPATAPANGCRTCVPRIGSRRCGLFGRQGAPEPPPLGFCIEQTNAMQAELAEREDFVIYSHEWRGGGPDLGPAGQRHFQELVRRLGVERYPVVIEPTDDPAVAAARRERVIELLTEAGIPDAATRVVVAYPKADPLFSDEAPRVYRGVLRGGQGQGNGSLNGGGGLGGGGGFGGGGGLGGGFGGGGSGGYF